MLRAAAFAGGGLEFLGTLSARLFVLCAWRTVVPVDQGCTGWVMLTCNVTYSWWFAFPLTRRWCVCYSRRSKDAGPEIVKRSPRVRCKPQVYGAYQSVMVSTAHLQFQHHLGCRVRTRPSSGVPVFYLVYRRVPSRAIKRCLKPHLLNASAHPAACGVDALSVAEPRG